MVTYGARSAQNVRSSMNIACRRLGIVFSRGGRSFMPMLNSGGDITDPCGVPLGIVSKVSERRCPIRTVALWLVRKKAMYL